MSDKPIQLINYDSGVLRVNEDASKFLQSIREKVSIIAILGNPQTGKTHLLNKLFLKSNLVFPTAGINIYRQLISIENNNYLILDSDNSEHAVLITVLLSSLLIYNSVGPIDDQALISLSNLNILSKISTEEDCFPQFLLTLRDFQLQLLDEEGEQLSPKEYMERCLQQQRGFSEGIEVRNRTRRILTQIFKHRDCWTLMRAVTEQNTQRKEFQEQLNALKIGLKITPKRVRNLATDGPTLDKLLRLYVDQINLDQINVEQVYDIVQDQESERHLKKAIQIYDSQSVRIPTSFEELKLQHKESSKLALEYLRDRVNSKSLEDELHLWCKSKIKAISIQNEQEAEKLCQNFINVEFTPIRNRLSNGEYRSLLEFERDIKLFYQFLLEHGPKTVLKQNIYQEFYKNMLTEGAQCFLKKLTLTSQNASTPKKVEIVENDIIEEQRKQIQKLLLHVRECETIIADKDKNQISLNDEIVLLKEQISAQQRQFDRAIFVRESENEKQRALNEQRVMHLSRQLEQFQKKESQMDSSFMSNKSEYNSQMRDVQQKYEQVVADLQEKLLQMNDKVTIQQDQISSLEQQNQQLVNKLQQVSIKLQDSQMLVTRLQQQQSQIVEEDDESEYLKGQISSLEQQLKEKSEKYISLKHSLEREYALVSQEKSFLEVQLQDAKQQLLDQRRNYEKTLQLQELSSENHRSQSKQLLELKDAHLQEMRQIESDYTIQKQILHVQITELERTIDQLKQQLDEAKSEVIKERQSQLNRNVSLEDQLQKLTKEYTLLDQQKSRQYREYEDKLSIRNKIHTQEVDELKAKYLNESLKQQVLFEEQLQQLRIFYDEEKMKLEIKFNQDRIAQQQRTSQEESELVTLQKELKILKKLLKEKEQYNQQLQNQINHENDLRQRQISQLENTNKELNIRIQKQSENNATESLQAKDQEIQDIKQKLSFAEKVSTQLQQEKLQLSKQISDLKAQIEQQIDSDLQAQAQLDKQVALANQENEFLQSRIDDLLQQIEILKEYQQSPSQVISIEYPPEIDFSRIDKMRGQLKEQEISYNKIIQELKSEIESLQQKLATAKTLTTAESIPRTPRTPQKDPEILTLKARISELEAENQEIIANYDRDQVLWQGKFKFLQEQKDQAKKDLAESMTKFEQTISHLQKVRAQDLEAEDKSISEMFVTLEKKYQLQVQDLTLNHEMQMKEQENRILNQDVQSIRIEYETKMEELYIQFSEERQNLRNKISEAEERYKDSEARRSQMVFEHEKERARWCLEKDDIVHKKKIGVIRSNKNSFESEENTHKSIHLGESFEAYYAKKHELINQ